MPDDTNQSQNPNIPQSVSQQSSVQQTAVNPPVNSEHVVQTPASVSIPAAPTQITTPPSSSQQQNQPSLPSKGHEEPLPPTHISSGNKEQEPLPAIGRNEWDTLVEPEMLLSEEVKEAGVVQTPQPEEPILQLPQPISIPLISEVPAVAEEAPAFHFPMTLLQTQDVIKKDKNIEDSLRWLATLIFREIGIAARRKREEENSNLILK